jgi:hypothetical protein
MLKILIIIGLIFVIFESINDMVLRFKAEAFQPMYKSIAIVIMMIILIYYIYKTDYLGYTNCLYIILNS